VVAACALCVSPAATTARVVTIGTPIRSARLRAPPDIRFPGLWGEPMPGPLGVRRQKRGTDGSPAPMPDGIRSNQIPDSLHEETDLRVVTGRCRYGHEGQTAVEHGEWQLGSDPESDQRPPGVRRSGRCGSVGLVRSARGDRQRESAAGHRGGSRHAVVGRQIARVGEREADRVRADREAVRNDRGRSSSCPLLLAFAPPLTPRRRRRRCCCRASSRSRRSARAASSCPRGCRRCCPRRRSRSAADW
jgi:hypothetical protein